MKVRLCGIDAPELKQPGGVESRDHLRSLLPVGQPVSLLVADRDRYGRKVSEVYVSAQNPQRPEEEKEVSYEQVARGNAYVYPRYVEGCPNGQGLKQGEAVAQQSRIGIWGRAGVERPWEYRKRERGDR